ncbi:transmembrane protein, putative [Medicago truncatula]|uniref:Transmembrane protein, putative n=1 Tax=Medicago truncatula TaxID=3880 RepID=A0A072UBR8_MEDTR|nr:transmembrane protein, putative [Medicago truncatula]
MVVVVAVMAMMCGCGSGVETLGGRVLFRRWLVLLAYEEGVFVVVVVGNSLWRSPMFFGSYFRCRLLLFASFELSSLLVWI